MMVLKQEIKFQWKSFLIWSLSVLLFLGLFFGIYPTFQEEAEAFTTLLQKMPQALLESIGLDPTQFFQLKGFLAYLYHYLHLMLGISGLLWGFQMMGRENSQNTNEFLLVKPINRRRIFWEKLALGEIMILGINGILLTGCMVAGFVLEERSAIREIWPFIFSGALVQILFFSMAALLAVLLPPIKNQVGLASSLGLGFFLILLIARLIEKDALRYLTPYGMMDPTMILKDGISTNNVIGMIIISVLMILLSLLIYERKDWVMI